LEWCKDLITKRIRRSHWLFFVLSTVGLILSLVGVAMWRGEQQVNAENFRLTFSLSILGVVIFGVLLTVAALYLRRWTKR
jgi:uncharacterized membrane protein